MLVRISLICLVLLALPACNTRPRNVLGRKKMYKVLKDMQLAEAYVKTQYLPDSTKSLYFESVLYRHNVSQAQYDSSMVWYSRNIHILSPIMEKIINEYDEENSYYSMLKEDSIAKDLKMRPIIDDLWDLSRRWEIIPSSIPFYKVFRVRNVPTITNGEEYAFNFKVVTPKLIHRLDSINLDLFFYSDDSLLTINRSFINALDTIQVIIPFDSLFTQKTSMLGKITWRGLDTIKTKYPIYIDSIRFDSREINIPETIESDSIHSELDTQKEILKDSIVPISRQ